MDSGLLLGIGGLVTAVGGALAGMWGYLERVKAAKLTAQASLGQQDIDHQKQMDAQALALLKEYKEDRMAILARMDALDAKHQDCERRNDDCERRHNEKDIRLGMLDVQLVSLNEKISHVYAKNEKLRGALEQLNASGCGVGGQCRAMAAQAVLQADSVMRAVAPQHPQPTNVTVNVGEHEHTEEPKTE